MVGPARGAGDNDGVTVPATPTGFLGLLMLDTRFPRPPGDIGHPRTFGVPVQRRVIEGAVPQAVVGSGAALRASGLDQRFVDAARALEQEGARAVITSCGFLVLLQEDLQRAVQVPLISSSLVLLPALLAREQRVGVLTISAERLGAEHLAGAGVPRERLADVVIQGVDPDSEFATRILGNEPTMDLERAGADVVAAARALKARAPDLTTVVLECTNMPPWRAAIEKATGLSTRWLGDHPALQWAR